MTKGARVEAVVAEVLREHEQQGDDGLPTTGRFVFYELEQDGLATKPSPDDKRPNRRRSIGWPPGSQDVTDALTRLRERGVVPWEWISDDTRRLSEWTYAETVADYLRDRVPGAMIDRWGGAAPPLILCESRATAGVLEALAYRYCCPIAGTSGQVAGFLHTTIAPRLLVPRPVFWIGDLDKSGGEIESNTRSVLEHIIGRKLDWVRLAITEDQVATLGIAPIWKVDGRDRTGRWAWEAESLTQAGLVAIVRDRLDALLPESLLSVLERERVQRDEFARYLAAWRPA